MVEWRVARRQLRRLPARRAVRGVRGRTDDIRLVLARPVRETAGVDDPLVVARAPVVRLRDLRVHEEHLVVGHGEQVHQERVARRVGLHDSHGSQRECEPHRVQKHSRKHVACDARHSRGCSVASSRTAS